MIKKTHSLRTIGLGLVLSLVITTASVGAMTNNENLISIAKAYVNALDDDCIYDDGYQCVDTIDADYQNVIDEKGTIAASTLLFWGPAYQTFLLESRLNDEQKKLKHYRIGFKLSEEGIEVLFRPLFLPLVKEGIAEGRIRATIGKEVKIMVSKKSYKVTKVLYGK